MKWFGILSLIFFIEIVTIPIIDGKDFSSVKITEAFIPAVKPGWVDSLMNTLSIEEKIAQLIFIRVYSNKDKGYTNKISELIGKFQVGGLTFFQGGPLRQAVLTNTWQSKSNIPLFISIDGEWGLAMRLDSLPSFPKQMTLGAIKDDKMIYKMASLIARDFRNLGIHINFAPVIDINSNPLNPVINYRSFGEDKNNVAIKGLAYMKGLQHNGVIATAKHFPGHGDTDKDSHHTLPVISHSKERIIGTELYPFKHLVDHDLMAVMTAHLSIPDLDDTPDLASSLSNPIVTGILKENLKFTGLIITDALEMKGVSNYNESGDAEVKALLAGNDVLLLPKDIEAAIIAVKKAIEDNVITEEEINEKCRKVLVYKYKLGLHYSKPVNTAGLMSKLNDKLHELTIKNLYRAAITVVNNENELIPLKRLDTLKIASVAIGESQENSFQNVLNKYKSINNYFLPQKPSFVEVNKLLKRLEDSDYNLIIVSIHQTTNSPKYNYGISQAAIDFIDLASKKHQLIVDVFANPYSISRIVKRDHIKAVIVSYEDNEHAQQASAEVIFGGSAASGRLPVSASKLFPVNSGVNTPKTKLRVGDPEEAGISAGFLRQIDTLAEQGIRGKAFPGCQVLVAKNGIVIYNKSFGTHTYNKKLKVVNDDIYDVASLTKIMATTMAIMQLSEKGILDIDQTLGKYLPELKGTDKKNIVIRDVLAHQSKLVPWIPFYLDVIKKGKPDSMFFSSVQSAVYSVKVAEYLYIKKEYQDTIYKRIFDSKLLKKSKYRYSDVGFYLLKMIIERVTKEDFETYLYEDFYNPLGLNHTFFNPYLKISKDQIIPTELDQVFRKQLVHGYVHDPGAAMLGGISGHAGLFMNTWDIAVLMQMLLQKGEYGAERYINRATIKEFTKQQFPLNDNRRGLGFDKPLVDYSDNGPTCKSVSTKSYGHSGFTGTYVWVDPEYDLVYVFLSNRVHPNSENKNIYRLNTRTEIQQAIYNAIFLSKI